MEPDSPKKMGGSRAKTEPLGAKAWCTKRAHETQEGLNAAGLVQPFIGQEIIKWAALRC